MELAKNKDYFLCRIRQYYASFICCLLLAEYGLVFGWSAATQLLLLSPASPLGKPLLPGQLGLLASLLFAGGLVGSLIAPLVADRLGRKTAALSLGALYSAGWALTAFSPSLPFLYSARFLLGLAGTSSFIISTLYISEIADNSIRGSLGSNLHLSFYLGLVLCYFLHLYLSYTWLAVASCIISLLFVVLFIFLPESPVFLLKKGKQKRYIKSFNWFKGHLEPFSINTEEVLERLPFKKLFTDQKNRRAIEISAIMFLFDCFSGAAGIELFMSKIFKEGNSILRPSHSTLVSGVVQLFAACISMLVIERSGRRSLALAGLCAMGLSWISLGAYFRALEEGYLLNYLHWLPLAFLSVYFFAHGLVASLPYIVTAEVTATPLRAPLLSLMSFFSGLLNLFNTNLFSFLSQKVSNSACFWTYGSLCFLGSVIVFVRVPESKGLSFLGIQELLGKESKRTQAY